MRRALLLLAAGLALALALGACGGGGGDTAAATAAALTDPEADAQILDDVLSRQSAAVSAYARSLPALRGASLAAARKFRAQEQEHVDGILKELRGLGEEPEPEPAPIEASGQRSEADYLLFLYEMERATIEAELSAVSKLTTPSARSLLASTVASQAQHLVLLRRALGATPLASVPEAFENGTAPAP